MTAVHSQPPLPKTIRRTPPSDIAASLVVLGMAVAFFDNWLGLFDPAEPKPALLCLGIGGHFLGLLAACLMEGTFAFLWKGPRGDPSWHTTPLFLFVVAFDVTTLLPLYLQSNDPEAYHPRSLELPLYCAGVLVISIFALWFTRKQRLAVIGRVALGLVGAPTAAVIWIATILTCGFMIETFGS